MKEKIREFLKKKKFRLGTYTAGVTVGVVAAAVIINMCAGAVPVKYTNFDLTSSELYSISQQTETVVSKVEDQIKIYWIVQDSSEDATLEKLIEKYKDLNSNIKVEKVDPVVNPNFAYQYTSESVYNNSLVIVNETTAKSRYVGYYDIFQTTYDEEYNEISSFNGEGALTSAINYVCSDSAVKAYYLTGHGEETLPTELSDSIEGENISLESLSLLTEETVPEDCGTLIIFSPGSDLSKSDKEKIEAYLEAGGNLMLFTSCSDAELSNLYDMMASYGAEPVNGMVVEGNQNYFLSNYANYLVPAIESHDITRPLVDGNYYVIMPMAQAIEITGGDDSTEVTPLLTTSASAFSKKDGINSTSAEKTSGDIETEEGFSLAVAITKTTDSGEANIVWVGSSYMADSNIDEMSTGSNTNFLINSLGWLNEIEDSITIRAKDIENQYLTLTSAQSTRWTAIIVVVIPLAFLAAGIYVTLKRRKL